MKEEKSFPKIKKNTVIRILMSVSLFWPRYR